MSSDSHVVVREERAGGGELVILDTKQPTKPRRTPMSADSALMHPNKTIIALRMGVNVQLYDIGAKRKLKIAALADAITFWRWVADDTLAIVTNSAVYHWNCDDENAAPELVFERHPSLADCQVIGYCGDLAMKWFCVHAIAQPTKPGGPTQGRMQLYSVDKKISQPLTGHAATFAYLQLHSYKATLFAFAGRDPAPAEGADGPPGGQFRVIEIGGAGEFPRVSTDIYYPPEYPGDFPVALHASNKFPSIVYMVTRAGFVHLFDLESAKCIYTNRISETTVFASVPHRASGGVMGLNRAGQLLLVAVDTDKVVPYVRDKLGDDQLATALASRNGFAGAENTFYNQFEDALEDDDIRGAAEIAASSPGGCLRTADTISRFRQLGDGGESGIPPILTYFQACMASGKLNQVESAAIGMQLRGTDKVKVLEKWIKEDKLTCTEELGDVLRDSAPVMALGVYIKAKAHEKVIQCMIQTGQSDKIGLYAKKVGMKVNHRDLVEMAAQFNPKAALEVANNAGHALVLADPERQRASIESVSKMVDMFLSKGMLNEATTHAMENLTDSDPQEGPIQTKVLKACLMNAPQVAEGILSQDIWHQYDRFKIAMLCERVGLFQHALENYSDLSDVKRVITNTHVINPEFILHFFSTIHPDAQIEVLQELITSNPRANIRLCVSIEAKYTEPMGGPEKIIPIFDAVKAVPDALYYYLAAVVTASDSPEVHNRFIEISTELGQFNDADTVTRQSNHYDPERIKRFLFEKKPRDPRPLINVCDRFGYVDELTRYFIKNRMMKFVEGYVQRVNPTQCPVVVGTLLDERAMPEKDIAKLILSVKNMVPVDELVREVEERGKLPLLLQFLESRIADGATDVDVHTGVAKVYISKNMNAQHFLETNSYYDSRKVGAYCARREPFLAYIAYKRGQCDEEVVQVTNDNSLFKEQAMYAVHRANDDLWAIVLAEDNPFRRLVVDQVISSALPGCKRPEKVSAAVKAFLDAGMPDVLMELLEKLVMQTSNTAFSRNTNLQNLLILTAIGAAPQRVIEYIRRLDNYDGPDIAPSCISAGLFEEAYTIYYKFEKFDDALDVLLEHLKDFSRAEEFAIRLDRPDVWLKLGIAQLNNGIVADGIRSLIRARDVSKWELVVQASRDDAESESDFKMIVKFLRIARKKIREPELAQIAIDTELLFSLCRLNALTDVEEFMVVGGCKANLEEVGDRCFDIELYIAAKMMFRAVPCWGKLAHTHIMLKEYKEAVYAAKKADRIPTWRIVCYGCVDGEKFEYAAICALRLVLEVEEMQECIEYYEDRGHFQEIIDVLDRATNHTRAHPGIFTELAVLLSKYREDQMLNFCRMWHSRLNVPRVCRACEHAYLWDSLAFLYITYEEYDNAANVMMDHSTTAYTPDEFLDTISKVGALRIMYRSIDFYLGEHPEKLDDLLNILAPRIDGSRAVEMLRRARAEDFGPLGCLPLAMNYLLKIQRADVPEVNEAINTVFVEEENVEGLRRSVEAYTNFDQMKLARELENHQLLEMRRVASRVYARGGRHEKAIEIAERDTLYNDMIYAVAQSEDEELAEMYAAKFAEEGKRECFTALLYACYNFFAPDVAMEYAWTGGLRDFAMPFLIQTVNEAGKRLTTLETERRDEREIEERIKKEEEEIVNEDVSVLLYGLQAPQQQLMLTYQQAGGGVVGGSGMMGQQQPFGAGPTTPMIGWNNYQTTNPYGTVNPLGNPMMQNPYSTFAR